MRWRVGDQVRVGKGKTLWRVLEVGRPFTADEDFANLQRVDRGDVHTTVAVTRLTRA